MWVFKLAPNPVERFYRGGERIARFRRAEKWPSQAPEEWIASTTTVYGEEKRGLSLLDGRTLRDIIRDAPEAFLGPRLATKGDDPGLLVKLLDAGERLPVHYHPSDEVARRVLQYPSGKTEAWFVVAAEPGAVVWLGFARAVEPAELLRLLETRESEQLLSLLTRIPVRAGDALYVPAGVPHAIGEGVLIVEWQEASDLSVLLEWWVAGEAFADSWHLGLGQQGAVAQIDFTVWDAAVLQHNVRHVAALPGRHRLFPTEADRFFRGERVVVRDTIRLEPSYQVLIFLAGHGTLRDASGAELEVSAGQVVLAAHAAGALDVSGDLDFVRCLPGDLS